MYTARDTGQVRGGHPRSAGSPVRGVLLACLALGGGLAVPGGARAAPQAPSASVRSYREASATLQELLDRLWTEPPAQWQRAAQELLQEPVTAAEPAPVRDLRRAVKLALAIEVGADRVADLPQDATLLRAVRRGCLMPPSDALAGALIALDPGDPPIRSERLRLVAMAGTAALPSLRSVLAAVRGGTESPDLVAAAAAGLGRVGSAADALALAALRDASYPGIAGDATTAIYQIRVRLERRESWQAVDDLLARLAAHEADEVAPLLDAANHAAMHDLPGAVPRLEQLEALPSGQSSMLRDARAEVELGRAFLAIGQHAPADAFLERARVLESLAPGHDRGARSVRARAACLHGLERALEGDDEGATTAFVDALRAAPYDQYEDEFGAVLGAPFGLLGFLQGRLIAGGRAADAVRVARLVLEAQRRHRSYYPIDLDLAQNDERVRTSLPLTIAQWTLSHLASAKDVEQLLAPLIRLTAAPETTMNTPLLAECYLTQGDARFELGDAQGALESYLAAEKSFHELEQSEMRADLYERDQRLDPPLSAYRRVLEPWWWDDPVGSRWSHDRARVALRLAYLESELFHDAERMRVQLRIAHDLDPADQDLWLVLARFELRRGEPERARRLLARVEPLSYRLYNAARGWALLGERDLALQSLGDYLRWLKTDAARERYRRLARSDSDFASINGDPRFVELVGRD